jgi:hypothetical protein
MESMNAARCATLLAMLIAVACFSVWFQRWSLDGLQGALFGALLHQDTAYAEGYTDQGFRAIRIGMTDERVRSVLGAPLGVGWSYRATRPQGCASVSFRNGRTRSWAFGECEKLGVRVGLSMDAARQLLGPSDDVYWLYSESPSDTNYRERVIRFSGDRVVEIIKGWYLD